MNSMIAFCGLNCETCPVYVATREPNPLKQLLLREEVAGECRSHYNMEIRTEEITDCDGCHSDRGHLLAGCRHCPIRHCNLKKGIDSCARCDEYPCDHLLQHFEYDPESRVRLEVIRSM